METTKYSKNKISPSTSKSTGCPFCYTQELIEGLENHVKTCSSYQNVLLYCNRCPLCHINVNKGMRIHLKYKCKKISWNKKDESSSPKLNISKEQQSKTKDSKGLRSKVQCEICQKYIDKQAFAGHFETCNIYSKWLETNSTGFKCKVCSFSTHNFVNDKKTGKALINAHMKYKHSYLSSLKKVTVSLVKLNLTTYKESVQKSQETKSEE